MNKENILKWVEALESDKYEQGKHSLCADNRYCCLGVACQIAIENGLPVKVEPGFCAGELRFDGASGFLPDSVANWLGVHKYFELQYDGELLAPNLLNDTCDLTFKQISQLIREQLLKD